MADQPPRRRFIDSLPIQIGVAVLIVVYGPMIAIVTADRLGQTGGWHVNPIALGILAKIAIFPSVILIVMGILEVIWDNRRSG